METIIVLGFLAILVFAFAGGMKEQLLKSTEADQRELDGHRKSHDGGSRHNGCRHHQKRV